MYSMCLFMTPSAFFPLTLIFFYEKGFVSPCVKHIKSFDFESLKAALQLQLLFFLFFSNGGQSSKRSHLRTIFTPPTSGVQDGLVSQTTNPYRQQCFQPDSVLSSW